MFNSRSSPTELAIIVPVLNEDKNFPHVHRAIQEHIATDHRVLVVYDSDDDTTVPVVQALAKNDPKLFLVKNTLGRGPASALRAGLNAVRSGPVLVVMADLSDDLRDVKKMLELYENGFSIVCGSRYMPGGNQVGAPFVKRTLSRVAGVSLYVLRKFPTRDVTNNFKLYDADFLRSIQIESKEGFCIAMEITVKAFLGGQKITEIPTVWRDRTEGKSNFKLFRWLPHYLKWYFLAFVPRYKSH